MNRLICLLLVGFFAGVPAFPQQQPTTPANIPQLVQLFQSKGYLTADEVASIGQSTSTDEAFARLMQIFYSKGMVNKQEYEQMQVPSLVPAGGNPVQPHLVNALITVAPNSTRMIPASGDLGTEPGYSFGAIPADTGVIPAVAPVRVLPIDIPKQGGLIPDIKLGSGANLKLYGFFKASAIESTAGAGGGQVGSNDFPLPLLLQNGPVAGTGPGSGATFYMKARSSRFGSLFEWVPKGSDMVVTGRLEMDFEGDYTTVNNRNVSSLRSSQVSLRLAWVRLDTKFADIPVFAEFGQDWTLLGSSTQTNIFETTQNGAFFGNNYERLPQIKVGAQFSHGDFKFEPEFAILVASSADSSLTADQRTRFGDMAGPQSNQPAVEGRLVFQFPLNRSWVGVAPAQFIVSGHHAEMNEIIPGAPISTTSASLPAIGLPNVAIPGATCANGNSPPAGSTVLDCFPQGISFDYPQNIFTVEAQLPTPWVTAVAKWYKGADLRFFFGGQLNTAFTDSGAGLVEAGAGSSFSETSIQFGCPAGALPGTCAGNITAGQLEPIRGQGGFAQLSFPLSRIFHADPEGRNAGWVLAFTYGTDRTKREDVIRSGGNGLWRTDMGVGTLSYKLNKWVSLVNEISYYQTRIASDFGETKFFDGHPVTVAHNWRNEFGTIVTF
jgi:hypothetical protein